MSVTTRNKFGGYILRERKGQYYVYKLDYVGPLIDVVETYLKLKLEAGVLGGAP